MKSHTIPAALVFICLLAATVFGQEPLVYPAKGQNQDQMEQDRYQCYSWSRQQTGFDPMQAPPQQQAAAPNTNPMRGAARGAAAGAVGGAIAGDAGKGAAIGAGTGAVVGGSRRRQQERQQAETQQQASAYSADRGGYNRAFAACMEGRGYTVK